MPTDEFFNTGIYTYLWVFNKKKSKERKDKVILINGSNHFKPLKKSRGKKRKEMVLENRNDIVKALSEFKDNDFSKVVDKWHFYYNKQSIMLTNVDENGLTYESHLPVNINKDGEEIRAKSIKLVPVKINQTLEETNIEITDFEITDFEITEYDNDKYLSLKDYFEQSVKPTIGKFDYKEANLKIYEEDTVYWFDQDKETLVEDYKGKQRELGCGKIIIKATYKKATKTKNASIVTTVELTPNYKKDYEIIPYSPDEYKNQQWMAEFMAKYITKPFVYLDNVIGVEINFNKEFFIPEEIEPIEKITSKLSKLEKVLTKLEKELAL
jgi:type I restriction enzyme M protein